jgi:hypothetical protein
MPRHPRPRATVEAPPVRIRLDVFRELLEDNILGALRLGITRAYKHRSRPRQPAPAVCEAIVSEQARAVELVLDDMFDFGDPPDFTP